MLHHSVSKLDESRGEALFSNKLMCFAGMH
jgi:hypothetical protein